MKLLIVLLFCFSLPALGEFCLTPSLDSVQTQDQHCIIKCSERTDCQFNEIVKDCKCVPCRKEKNYIFLDELGCIKLSKREAEARERKK